MTDPRDKATSIAPATLGEGCLSRFDPDALSVENGADFDGAAQLWEDMQTDEHASPGGSSGRLDSQ